ncbi:MAG: glycerophosphodiester phosphodiesterase [Dehalococcoidia bacterium]
MINQVELPLPAHPLPELPSLPRPCRQPLVVAHRGYAAWAPENTLAAVRLAIACGADWIEIDVRATRDGMPVVMHDSTLDRTTTGNGPVREWSFWELREQVAIAESARERVPTLAEVLAVTRGRVPLAIEVKEPEVTERALRDVSEADASTSVAIWSFHRQALEIAREQAPHVPRAFLHRGSRDGDAWSAGEFLYHAERLGARGASFFPEDIDTGVVEAARERGLQVYTGIVNDAAGVLRVIRAGVDAVITDEPVALRALFAG